MRKKSAAKRFIDFLNELSTDEVAHSGGSFMGHLIGTHDLLKKWGNSEDLCLAGMFHACYGTEAFQVEVIDRSRRALVRKRIGRKAERLVYLFCARSALQVLSIVRKKHGLKLRDRFENKMIPVSRTTLKELCELWFANWSEQAERVVDSKKELRESFEHFREMEHLLSPKARQELHRRIGKPSP